MQRVGLDSLSLSSGRYHSGGDNEVMMASDKEDMVLPSGNMKIRFNLSRHYCSVCGKFSIRGLGGHLDRHELPGVVRSSQDDQAPVNLPTNKHCCSLHWEAQGRDS